MTIRDEHYEVLRTLSREQLADLMLGLMGDTEPTDTMVKMVQHFIESDSKMIERHIEDLEAIAEREAARQEQNRINGAKGGRPPKKGTEKKQKPTVKTSGYNQWLKPVVKTGGFDEEKETQEKENFPPHPLYKEKEKKEKEEAYNNDDIAHARVECFALLSSLSGTKKEILKDWAHALGHPPKDILDIAAVVVNDWANSCEKDVTMRHLYQAIKYQLNKPDTYGKISNTDRQSAGAADPLASVVVKS
jgi:hypothetical protein